MKNGAPKKIKRKKRKDIKKIERVDDEIVGVLVKLRTHNVSAITKYSIAFIILK